MNNLNYETMDFYRKVTKDYMTKNRAFSGLAVMSDDDFDHACELAASVAIKRDFPDFSSGSFVEAVVNNDLENAIARADNTAAKALKAFVLVKRNCFPGHEYKKETAYNI